MPGGASREIWSFECAMERGGETSRRAMVLRRDPGAHNISSNRRHEFMVIRAAFEERIPVPEVFWVSEDPAVLGSAFFIMERIDGETLARRLLRDDTYARPRNSLKFSQRFIESIPSSTSSTSWRSRATTRR
jgi:aminoglycoside phosphotransferase (APT) family kinase protein